MRLLIACLLICPTIVSAADWPQWRGPRGDGVSEETSFPTRWSATENVAWKVPLKGKGHSSPVIHGDKIFLATADEGTGRRMLMCLSTKDGKTLWEREVLTAPLEKKHNLNSYASATPSTDGQRVYITFLKAPNPWVVCYDVDGKELWRKSPGTFSSMHGWATVATLHKDLVILNCDHDAPKDSSGYLVAYDKVSGEERWRTPRPNNTRSYCNPLIFEHQGKTQMVLTGSKCTASYDPATGKQLWIVDGPTEQFVSSPVYADGIVFVTGGFPTFHYMGIDPSGGGDVTKTHVRWHIQKNGSYVPSPIAVNGKFFAISDEGRAVCLEPKTGEKIWGERLGKHHYPSPVSANGLIYWLSSEGEMFVVKASDKFEIVAQNKLDEKCNASPALAGGRIYIRTASSLYCIGNGSSNGGG
jgi:outer membrane protein assembly factor BamB